MGSITNGNDYQRGWNDGHQAALAGKDKNYFKMALSWKYVFHNETALKTYSEGYDKGYEEGIKEANVIQKVKSTDLDNLSINQTEKMENYHYMDSQNILTELGALKGLNELLVGCVNDLMLFDSQFRGYITSLKETGVPEEACRKFEQEYYQIDAANFKAITSNITTRDLPMIKEYCKPLETQFRMTVGMDPIDFRFSTPNAPVATVRPTQFNLRKGMSQDYSLQLDACNDLMNFLVEQRDKLAYTSRSYEVYCRDLESKGVPKQVAEHYYANFVQPNMMIFNNTISHIQDEDYKYMNDIRQSIIDAMAAVGILGYSHSRLKKM